MNTVTQERTLESGLLLRLVRGDLTEERVDAIVNAANSSLAHGGGVAAQIVRKGGAIIQRESFEVAPVPTGSAAMTSGGALPCKHVVHAVGPVWGEGEEDAKLRSALLSSLSLCAAHGLTSVSAPAISSGIFGFPKDRCARVLLASVLEFAASGEAGPVREVRFCLYDAPTEAAFAHAWTEVVGTE